MKKHKITLTNQKKKDTTQWKWNFAFKKNTYFFEKIGSI
jgi:hypothetical protein